MPLITPTGRAFADLADEVDNENREHLEPAELAALWKALAGDPFWMGYFRFQYHFGCRMSEVALLLKEEISYDKGTVIIRRLKKKDDPRRHQAGGFKKRTYGLTPALADILRAVRSPPKNPWFFGSKTMAVGEVRSERMASARITTGGWRAVSRSSAQKHFIAAATSAGIPPELRHTHVLRHTRATLLFAKGASESHVQMLLDHSSPTITRRYLHWAEDIKRRVDLMAQLEKE